MKASEIKMWSSRGKGRGGKKTSEMVGDLNWRERRAEAAMIEQCAGAAVNLLR